MLVISDPYRRLRPLLWHLEAHLSLHDGLELAPHVVLTVGLAPQAVQDLPRLLVPKREMGYRLDTS